MTAAGLHRRDDCFCPPTLALHCVSPTFCDCSCRRSGAAAIRHVLPVLADDVMCANCSRECATRRDKGVVVRSAEGATAPGAQSVISTQALLANTPETTSTWITARWPLENNLKGCRAQVRRPKIQVCYVTADDTPLVLSNDLFRHNQSQ